MPGVIKAKCVANDVSALPRIRRKMLAGDLREGAALQELDVGRVYDVSALEWRVQGDLWLFIHTVEGAWFPTPYPADLFEVGADSLPANWSISFRETDSGLSIKRISFPEWAKNDDFYERLINGDEAALEAYRTSIVF